MAFVVDKEELKKGLVIFRRGDVDHRDFYCRVKLPKEDRYKTFSLRTPDISTARQLAWRKDTEIAIKLENDMPIFNRSFGAVGQEYLLIQEERKKRREITAHRLRSLKGFIEGPLNDYVGTTQIHLIGHDSWDDYPAWRRTNGMGRAGRCGLRERTPEEKADYIAERARLEAKLKARNKGKPQTAEAASPAEIAARAKKENFVAVVSDATILAEMAALGAVMNFAIKKKYVPASHKFGHRPKLKKVRREEFKVEEYRKLHTVGRKWMKEATRPSSLRTREMVYNFILIMCNTGMRPPEARNLRWGDIENTKDKEGKDLVLLHVRGKGKQRKLVAPKTVGDYLERIRAVSMATEPSDPVFTTANGEQAKTLYTVPIRELLGKAELLNGADGVPRSPYCFRHTYATYRLQEGVGVYPLAEQMGTSVKSIEDHYGHVNAVKHAGLVLQGMEGWNPLLMQPELSDQGAKAKAATTSTRPRSKKAA